MFQSFPQKYNSSEDEYYFQQQQQQQQFYNTPPQNRTRFYSNFSENFMSTEASSEFEDYQNKSYLYTSNKNVYDSCDSFKEIIDQDGLIQVKPPKKIFQTPEDKKKFVEDYSKKLKTELCKNFMTIGFCKFGDKCSFAHGYDQLKDKQHLHSNYKTKPCKKFFMKGICQYGLRCQYLHSELMGMPQFRDFATKVYNQKKLKLAPQEIINDPLKRFARLYNKIKKNNITGMDMIIPGLLKNRLQFFEELTTQNNQICEKNNLTQQEDLTLKNNNQILNNNNFLQISKHLTQTFDIIQEEDLPVENNEGENLLFKTSYTDNYLEQTIMMSENELEEQEDQKIIENLDDMDNWEFQIFSNIQYANQTQIEPQETYQNNSCLFSYHEEEINFIERN